MATPNGWQATTYGAVFIETHERRGGQVDLPVLSVTKTRGPMLASERFGKALHGRDLAKYRVARRGTFVADPMLLWDGTIGRQDAADSGLVSPDYRVYELAEHVASDFMRYVVRDPRMLRYYQGGARGTNVRRNRIAREDFLRIPIVLPSLPEQQKIAAILSSVDEFIKKTEAVIASLQALRKAMMRELLTRGLPGRHTRFKQTEIGTIPETWSVKSTREAFIKLAVGRRYDKRTVHERAGVPVIDQSENGVIGFHDDVPGVSASKENPVVTFANHTCAVRWHCSPFSVIQNVFPLRGSPGVDTRFLFYVLQGRVTQSGYRGHWPALMETSVPVPDIEEQRAIGHALDLMEAQLFTEQTEGEALQALKKALSSVLLTGELRVSSDEVAA